MDAEQPSQEFLNSFGKPSQRIERIAAGIEPGANDSDRLPTRTSDTPGKFALVLIRSGVDDTTGLPTRVRLRSLIDDTVEGRLGALEYLARAQADAKNQGASIAFVNFGAIADTDPEEKIDTTDWGFSLEGDSRLAYGFGAEATSNKRNLMRTLCTLNPELFDAMRCLGYGPAQAFNPEDDNDIRDYRTGKTTMHESGNTWPPKGAPDPVGFGTEVGGATAISDDLLDAADLFHREFGRTADEIELRLHKLFTRYPQPAPAPRGRPKKK